MVFCGQLGALFLPAVREINCETVDAESITPDSTGTARARNGNGMGTKQNADLSAGVSQFTNCFYCSRILVAGARFELATFGL